MIEQIQFAKTIGVAKIDSLLQEMLLNANNVAQQINRSGLSASGVISSGSGQQANGQSPMAGTPDTHQWQVSYTRESAVSLIRLSAASFSPQATPIT